MVFYLIMIVVIGTIGFVGYIMYQDGKSSKSKTINKSEQKPGANKNTSNKGNKNKSVIKGIIKEPEKNFGDSQDLFEFDSIEVCNQDMALIKRSQNAYLGVFEIKGITYNLLSIEERIMLEENYSALLNGIDFPFQITIQSRKLELDDYVVKYTRRLNEIESNLKGLNEQYENAVDGIEKANLESEINRVYNQIVYGKKTLKYFEDRNVHSNLLERKYYITCEYIHKPSQYEHELSNDEILEIALNDLFNKFNIFDNTLSRNGLKCVFLNGFSIAEMLYASYNKEDASLLKFRNAVASKYNHLITTSKNIVLKKIDIEKKILSEEKSALEKKIADALKKS